MVTGHEFREDLWFRLNVFPILIPPLRDRKMDLPALLQHFINQKTKELNFIEPPTLSPGAINSLMGYHWPGNVRELENIIERAMILNPKGPLRFDHLNQTEPKMDTDTTLQQEMPAKLDEVITKHIKEVLLKTKGKINGTDGAAATLGVNPSTLRNRMKKLGIDYGGTTCNNEK